MYAHGFFYAICMILHFAKLFAISTIQIKIPLRDVSSGCVWNLSIPFGVISEFRYGGFNLMLQAVNLHNKENGLQH